ncbi:uncharacterized protein Dwil_GK27316 [Drosophila willistoni]|uniref:Uncharacterized protein n=1 Tax=Drosophila willistoni TaxID=7260 RepID=A0A0Q9WZD6_DROWI|nr:natterin-3 [Drosophila willistoni]KRF97537.1 uncharacterized protein Dwil_GK27316 [Drosophila willistoni]
MAQWVQSSINSLIPHDAFNVGQDADGAEMYVGRTIFESEILPVKIVPRRREAYVTSGGGEYLARRFDVLVGKNYDWAAGADGLVPQNAIYTGRDNTGQLIYIGRAVYKNTVTVGKVQPSRGCLILGYNGDEIEINAYEVLVST